MSNKSTRLPKSSQNGHTNGNRIEDILAAKNTSLTGAAIKSESERTPAEIANPMKQAVVSRTPNQKKYIKAIMENDVTMVKGPSGVGKTRLGVGMAVKYLAEGVVDRIIFIRPTVPCEEDLGFLPGDEKAKIDPYIIPLYDELADFLTTDQINKLTSGRKPAILAVPLGMVKGRSFKRCIILVDESQDASFKQLKRLITRLGEGSKMIFNGDVTQSDLFQENMETDFERFMDKLEGADGIGLMQLTPEDSQRHPKIASWLERI